MNWFKGEIAEAITTSKAKKAIFVVYIEGKDEKSSKITALINTQDVANTLEGDHFVAIKLEANSVPYHQFSQIYKQPPVPSIYFIGKTGTPLEILTDANNVPELQDKLKRILQVAGVAPASELTRNLIQNEQSASMPPANVVCENGVCSIKKEEPSTSKSTDGEKSTDDGEASKAAISTEEKAELAKKLLEDRREHKKKEEEEKERQKEIDRRKSGQSVQQLKRWQEEEELKQVLEQRKKEKRENQEARDRVLAQIAQDKAERASKFSGSPPETQSQPQTSTQTSPRPANTNVARIQFRLPDGRTATNDFPSSETLDAVHTYIRSTLNLSFSSYTLSTTFPRREFTENDRSQTLLDLELVPTAVILILPLNRGTISTNPGGGGFSGIFWTLLAPFFSLLGYIRGFFWNSGASGSSRPEKRSSDGSNTSSAQTKVRRGGETTVIKRQGNVHRLSNNTDSDDENNTWNGNSTQQM